VLANDSDADGDALRVTSVYDFLNGVQQQVAIPASGSVMLQSNHGAFTISADGSYSFTANDARAVQNHYAEDPLVYSVSDGHGGTGRAQVDVNLAGQQRPPLLGELEAADKLAPKAVTRTTGSGSSSPRLRRQKQP
jgi:VCBS repeat-containing protein